MIKPIIRTLTRPLFSLLPKQSQTRIRSIFNQDFQWKLRNKELTNILLKNTGGSVASGPFLGMQYVTKAVNGASCPKIVGCYEKELWVAISEIINSSCDRVIDIGAAEGYYAVGLALQMANTQVIAFEADTYYHRLLIDLSRLNSVGQRVDVRSQCSPDDLNRILEIPAKTAIVCDVEGAEMELMDPSLIPRLKECDLLVETHDFAHPGIAEFLRRSFQDSHSITTIKGRERVLQDWPYSEDLPIPIEVRLEMLEEHRSGVSQEWLWMKVNAPISD